MQSFLAYLFAPILDALARIEALLEQNQRMEVLQMAVLDDLTAQVTENTNLEASAIQLIQNIAAQLANAGTDPAKLAALKDQLKTSADALSAAIVANTPAAPPAP